MTPQEQKYLDKQLDLIEAAVSGLSVGLAMFGTNYDQRSHAVRTAMRLIKGDVMRIYKHGKRQGKSALNKH